MTIKTKVFKWTSSDKLEGEVQEELNKMGEENIMFMDFVGNNRELFVVYKE